MPRSVLRQAADRIKLTARTQALAVHPVPERFRVTALSPLELEGLSTDTLLNEEDDDVEVAPHVKHYGLEVGDIVWVHPEAGPDAQEIARWNVKTVGDSAGGFGPHASTTREGIVYLSVPPADPAHPIAVGTNDPRLGAGGGGGAVSSVNGHTGAVVLGYADVGAVSATDPRLSDARTPTGAAGGSLSGTYPNPMIASGAIADAQVSATASIAESKLNLASDAIPGTPSRRSLGTGPQQAAAGNDSRLSDSRAPTGAAGGVLAGTYPNPSLNVLGTGAANGLQFASVLGGTADANLYRAAAGILKSDGSIAAGASLFVGNTAATSAAPIYFGSAADTNLYRSAAGVLKTDTDIQVNGNLTVALNNTSKLYFGSAFDTSLFRRSASLLRTDSAFSAKSVGAVVYADVVGDGSTDDLPALNAALALLPPYSGGVGGGTIVIPAYSGRITVQLSGTFTLPDGVRLVGESMMAPYIRGTVAGPLISITGGFSSLENLMIVNQSTNIAAMAVDINGTSNVQARRCYFASSCVNGQIVRNHASFMTDFDHCRWGGAQSTSADLALLIDGGSNVTRVRSCSMTDSKHAIRAVGAQSLYVTGSQFESLSGGTVTWSGVGYYGGIQLDGVSGFQITGNYFEAVTGVNIQTFGGFDWNRGGVIGGNTFQGAATLGGFIDIGNCDGVTVHPNVMYMANGANSVGVWNLGSRAYANIVHNQAMLPQPGATATGTPINPYQRDIQFGTGSPEGVYTADPGAKFASSNGRLYMKTSGSSNTGWAPLAFDSASFTTTMGGLNIGSFTRAAWDKPAIESVNTAVRFGDIGDIHLLSNAYLDAVGWKYKEATSLASNIYLYNGDIVFRTAPANGGAAGAALTWTERLRIGNTGVVTIGGDATLTRTAAGEVTFGASPRAPTPTAADSSTKVATTAFVQGERALNGFFAYRNAAVSLATGSVVVFDTDSGSGFDPRNWYDTTTGRFTPQKAGYYRVHWSVALNSTSSADRLYAVLRKNGTNIADSNYPVGNATGLVANGTYLVQMNGSTDYLDVMMVTSMTSPAIVTGTRVTHFGAELVGT